MSARRIGVVFLAAAALAAPARAQEKPRTEEELLRDAEGLRAKDPAWREIAWSSCLLEGLARCRAQKKPGLVWCFIEAPCDEGRGTAFACAMREAVFSRKAVIAKVNADFVPIAIRAGVVAGRLGARGAETELSVAMGASRPDGQGLCVVDGAGRPVAWVLGFDDEESIGAFLDHAKALAGDAARKVVERYARYPSERLEDARLGDGERLPVPEKHAEREPCPSGPRVRAGSLVMRVVGRAVDAKGELDPATSRQDRYCEDRFELPAELQRELIAAVAREERAPVPESLRRFIAAVAHLGPLEVRPLESPVAKLAGSLEGGLLLVRAPGGLRIEGKTVVKARVSGAPGQPALEHDVELVWEGFAAVKEDRIARFVLVGRGEERLKWSNPVHAAVKEDLARLRAGRSLDREGGVRYAILGEPAPTSWARAVDPRELEARIGVLHESIRRRGGVPGIENDMRKLGELLDAEQLEQADRLVDELVARVTAPAGPAAPAEPKDDPRARIQAKLARVHGAVLELIEQGKVAEADRALQRALDALDPERR